MRIVLGIILSAWVSITFTSSLYNKEALAQQAKQPISPPHSDFRYLIVKNLPLHKGRLLQVLLDPKAFSEMNLRKLFLMLSERFPEPYQLAVGVYTSLEQLPTPEEEDYLASSEQEEPENNLTLISNIEKYPGASYNRDEGKEVFNYSMGKGQPKKIVGISDNTTSPNQTVFAQQTQQTISPPHSDFRYVIIHNLPAHGGRLVYVLLDQQAFSEKNLKELFLLLSKRFQQPKQLWVSVITNLEQVPTPEDEWRDYILFPQKEESEDNPNLFSNLKKYPYADYTRAEGKEFFKYSMGEGQPEKTIALSGKNALPKRDNKP